MNRKSTISPRSIHEPKNSFTGIVLKAGIISEKESAPKVSKKELKMRRRAYEEFAGSFSKVNKNVAKFVALSPEIQYAEFM